MQYKLLAAIAAMLAAVPATAQRVTLNDGQWDSEGQFAPFASPWCRTIDHKLLAPRDYANSVSWYRGRVNRDVQILWRWPSRSSRDARCGVYGYNFLAWGNYDGGATRAPVTPRQVGAIGDLTFAYGINYTADWFDFNGLGEFFLTYGAGAASAKAIEVGWFWHAPTETRLWAARGRQLGTYVDRFGQAWVAALASGGHGPFVVFLPPYGDRPQGTFDAKNALVWLRARGVVSNAWWFNGAALGVEPLGGSGSATIRWLTTRYY